MSFLVIRSAKRICLGGLCKISGKSNDDILKSSKNISKTSWRLVDNFRNPNNDRKYDIIWLKIGNNDICDPAEVATEFDKFLAL